MTRKEALQELLVKVKAGDRLTLNRKTEPLAMAIGGGDTKEAGLFWAKSSMANEDSMDAALSLFEAVLPGWEWWLESGLGASIRLKGDIFWSDHTHNDIPSRALLIATLEALVEMEDG